MSDASLKETNPSLPWLKKRDTIVISNMNADGTIGGSLRVSDTEGQLKVASGGGRQSQWLVEVVGSGEGEDETPPKVKLKSRFNGKYLRVARVEVKAVTKEVVFRAMANGTLTDKDPDESIFSVILDDTGKFTTEAVFQLQCQAYNRAKYIGSAPSQSGTGKDSPAQNVVVTPPGDGTYWTVK